MAGSIFQNLVYLSKLWVSTSAKGVDLHLFIKEERDES